MKDQTLDCAKTAIQKYLFLKPRINKNQLKMIKLYNIYRNQLQYAKINKNFSTYSEIQAVGQQ